MYKEPTKPGSKMSNNLEKNSPTMANTIIFVWLELEYCREFTQKVTET